ncbi:MAG TPA: sialate O-acetylesterase [Anaerolineae bacterium]|nr:sialate O-acetylesterase [Anaerolineae bacterium]
MKPRYAIHLLITLVGFSALTAGCSFPNDNTIQTDIPIKVLILLGQSNMVGCAHADEFPPGMSAASDRRLILTDDGWIPLVPGPQNGPEISLAYELAQAWPEETIGIIKVAVGGTGIRAFVPDWSQELADITGDGHKGSLYAQVKAGIDQATSTSEVEFIGVVWKQGGKDSWSAETAEGYLDYLRSIIDALRQDTETPDLPLFISTYFDAQDLLLEYDAFAEAARGREALFDVLMAHNLAQDEIPHTQTVTTGWLPVTADGIHFNTEGQILQGQILADAIWFYYEFEGI